ncbi:MAG: glycosyltransferase family 9 protein [Oligoflexus sp.]
MNRILLIQLRQLGDILLTTPAIRAVRRAYPHAQLDFLTHRMGKMILANNPDLNHLWTYHEDESWLQQGRLMQALKRQRYDCIIDFMYNPRSALMAWWTKAPQRIAFESRRSWAYTDVVSSPTTTEYIVREKFHLLKFLGIPPVEERLILPWHEKDSTIVGKFAKKEPAFGESKCRVIISATHRREIRQWPVERYAQIADRLQNEWGAAVTWIWGPGEEKIVESGMSFCSRPMLKAPATSFGELAALIANSDLFLGNSNGPSHVAVSADTCSLQLHGPTLAKAWCPLNERHMAIQAKRMEDITVDEVWRKLRSLKPEVEKKSKSRRSIGVRMNWKQTHEPIPY